MTTCEMWYIERFWNVVCSCNFVICTVKYTHTCALGMGFSSLYDAIHGWMTGWTDGWMGHMMKKTSRKMTTTSFTIYNIYRFCTRHIGDV